VKLLSIKTGLLVLGVMVAVGVLTAGAVTLAASPKVPAVTPTASKTSGPSKYCDGFVGHLAGDLGKSQGDVSSAISKAVGQTLADAVKNGDLTQSQADKLKNQLAQSGGACQALSRLRQQFGSGAMRRPGALTFGLDAAASALKTTTTELKQDIAKGMTLHQIADSKGVTEDQFQASVEASLTQKLDQAVQKGKVTKDQEAKILARADQAISMLWDRSLPHR
jgi:hypothetical protein